MVTNQKCTLLVNSCDAYADVWALFFKALFIQWPDCDMKIVLNTELKQYEDGNNSIETFHYKGKKKNNWGKRYKEVLEYIDTPYVFPVLEDFVLSEPFTGQEMLRKVFSWMDENTSIGVFYLHKHPNVIQEPTKYTGFGLMPTKCDYKLTTQIGVWRKDYLEKCIKGIETPWEWELYSTKRAWRYSEEQYALLNNQKEVYIFPWGGVIWRGLWHPDTVELANKYDVKIDFSKRGFMDMSNPYRLEPFYSMRDNFPDQIFSKEFWSHFSPKVLQKIKKIRCER